MEKWKILQVITRFQMETITSGSKWRPLQVDNIVDVRAKEATNSEVYYTTQVERSTSDMAVSSCLIELESPASSWLP